MIVYIDADGCPVVDLTLEVTHTFQIETIIVCDSAHYIERDSIQTITIPSGNDAVDFYIVNQVRKGDLVITQDYGLASLVLAKGGFAINNSGLVFTSDNMPALLERRHLVKKMRKANQRVKGPKKRDDSEDENFYIQLTNLLKSIKK